MITHQPIHFTQILQETGQLPKVKRKSGGKIKRCYGIFPQHRPVLTVKFCGNRETNLFAVLPASVR
jgi:hypothetical protein